MAPLLERFRTRLIPGLLTAAGVTMVGVGLWTYTNPVEAGLPTASPVPASVALSPSPSPSPSNAPASPSASPETSPASPSPSPVERVATRVVVPALRIDLPVIRPPGGAEAYPLCDVAMFIQELHQPGEPGATYIYAHARKGMFLPILDASKINNGRKMLGMLVQVYTSDDQLYLYEINEVRRHQTTLQDAVSATTEQLWLQTSEGPRGTPGKTQVIAMPLSFGPADPGEAHPTPKPAVCG